MAIYYKKFDKIMLLETGEVFTVFEDLGYLEAPSITVEEDIGRLIMRWEVRPAGLTRQRDEIAKTIVEPEPPPPPPEDRINF